VERKNKNNNNKNKNNNKKRSKNNKSPKLCLGDLKIAMQVDMDKRFVNLLQFLFVFVTLQYDVTHNDDGICKIISPIICFLLITPYLGIKILYTI
jgi:hypothetical protein